jgi:aminotransferase
MEAAVVGLNFKDDYYLELQNHYTHMKNLFINGLKGIGLNYTEPQGAYYVLVDISEFIYKSDIEFCEWLAREVGVGAVPGSSFFKDDVNQYIRFHFAKKDETLNMALERLSHIYLKARKL